MAKQLALVIHALYGGGAERLMSQLANRWAAAGHRVHLITLAKTSTDQYVVNTQVQRHGLNLIGHSQGLVTGLKANWQRVRSLRSLIDELSPDMILSFCDRMNITTITACLSLNRPIWIAEHSDPSRQRLGLVWETWRQWAYRRLVRRPRSGCVVLTEPIAQGFRRRFPGLETHVIPPAIELSHCTNTTTHIHFQSHAESATYPCVLSVGRHSPEKNLSGLLQAWAELRAEFPQWRLILAGDGPEHSQLRQLARHLRIGDSVDFAGWVSDPWSLYRQCSLLAMTSRYEGVPVAMLEAMASGVACASTPCSTTVQEFAAAGAVQLANSNQPRDIAQALGVLMRDPQRRREVSERGRLVAVPFGWESIGPRWDELLNKLD